MSLKLKINSGEIDETVIYSADDRPVQNTPLNGERFVPVFFCLFFQVDFLFQT